MRSLSTVILIVALCSLSSVSAAPSHNSIGNGRQSFRRIKRFWGLSTYYEVGSGSCGEYDNDSELVVALNRDQMANGPNPNTNPNCDHMVFISGDSGSTTARIVDTCPSCPSGTLDMSPSVYERVCGSLASGVCTIRWNFI
ncbi:hypothetical protein RMATCC62417_17836 [Rhizopus microsporus]|nr:hypothetical protein RMATCC62417_17836 [Rhizopus microsporus]